MFCFYYNWQSLFAFCRWHVALALICERCRQIGQRYEYIRIYIYIYVYYHSLSIVWLNQLSDWRRKRCISAAKIAVVFIIFIFFFFSEKRGKLIDIFIKKRGRLKTHLHCQLARRKAAAIYVCALQLAKEFLSFFTSFLISLLFFYIFFSGVQWIVAAIAKQNVFSFAVSWI